jgi:hypothetical protein
MLHGKVFGLFEEFDMAYIDANDIFESASAVRQIRQDAKVLKMAKRILRNHSIPIPQELDAGLVAYREREKEVNPVLRDDILQLAKEIAYLSRSK